MPRFNGNDTIIDAEQFDANSVPWPNGVEENEGIGGQVFYSIMTPDGERNLEDGDFVIYSGDVSPVVMPYEAFVEEYSPLPDDVLADDEPNSAMADALSAAGVDVKTSQAG